MTLIGKWDKHPEDIADRYVDWSARLGTATISTSTWTANSADITLSSAAIDGSQTQVRVTGGAADTDYYVQNKITLSTGETETAQILLSVDKDYVA